MKNVFWFLVWCAALVLVWDFGHREAVRQAMLLFFAAGVVPGTHIVLTPDQVLKLMGGLLAVSVLLIFSRELTQPFRRRSSRRRPVIREVSAAGTLSIPQPVTIIALPKRPGLLRRLEQLFKPGILTLCLLLVASSAFVVQAIMRFWLWCEPHIRTFDRQIELTLKRNERIAQVLAALEGNSKSPNQHRTKSKPGLAPRA